MRFFRLRGPATTTRSTWLYLASLLEIAIATDILTMAWVSQVEAKSTALSVPLALALVAVAASFGGKNVAMIATLAAAAALLSTKVAQTGQVERGDALGVGLFCVTAVILAGLAMRRLSLETSLVQSEAAARDWARREVVMAREKDEFLSLVAHELRNPMSVIVGGAGLLERDVVSGRDRDQLIRDLAVESRRVSLLIEDLLALARLDDGLAPNAEPLLLQHLVPQVVADFKGRYPNEVTLLLDPNLPLTSASRVQVERVLWNVLDNAGKYSSPASPIIIEVGERDGQVRIDVLDSGSGVAADASDLIFERFYRGEAHELTRGYGLGLAISKRLVEANRGEIWARRREEGGLDVGFSLPIYRQDAA